MVEKITEQGMWWGQAIYNTPGQRSGERAFTNPIFVRAECKCSAEQKILTVAKEEDTDAIAESLGMRRSIMNEPGPYKVTVSSIENDSACEGEKNNCGCD